MDSSEALHALASLSQPTRLAAFRALVAQAPQPLPAGALAAALHVPQNTLSTHLGVLARAGLVTSTRHGRHILYCAELARIRSLILFLLKDCCGGQPELCARLVGDLAPCCSPEAKTDV